MTQIKFEDALQIEDPNLQVTPPNPEPPVTEGKDDPSSSPDEVDIKDLNPTDFGGDRFDIMGNLIKDGKVVMSKKDLIEKAKENKSVKTEESEEVEEYIQDKQGNLVDKSGKVIYEKGTFTIKEDGTVELVNDTNSFIKPLVNKFTELGYSFKDENDQEIAFDDSEEGYLELTQHIAEQNANTVINNWLESNPEVKRIYDHLQTGRSMEDYLEYRKNYNDYTKMEEPVTKEGQEKIVMDYYTKLFNLPEKDIKDMVTLLADSGKLEEKSKEALNALKVAQVEEEKASQQARIEAEKAAKKQQQDTINQLNSIISTGKIGSFEIPEKLKTGFFEYLTKPVENGMTKASLEYEKLPLEDKLVLEYLLFNGLNFDKLTAIKKEEVKGDLIRERAKAAKKIIISKSPNFKRENQVIPDITTIQ